MNYQKTFYSPLNKSTSKQLYSFSRADRFQPSRRSECKSSFYETKRGAFDKRSTSFGFGEKLTFQNREGVPEAGHYNKVNGFSQDKMKKRGWSFGKDNNRNILLNPEELALFPGPGNYISQNEKHKTGFGSGFQNVSYSIRGKFQDPLSKHGNELGPGQYQPDSTIHPHGKYYNSKFTNSACRKIGKDLRFEIEKVELPGPGKYYGNEKVNMNATGTFYVSKFKTNTVNSFPVSKRPHPANLQEVPGPGKYTRFSDFSLQNKIWNQQTEKCL